MPELKVIPKIPYIKEDIPHIIKYMGSKKPIIDFIISNIEAVHENQHFVCDLFSGSCSIGAALRKKYKVISNDIQDYSRILAQTYFSDLSSYSYDEINEQIENSARIHVAGFETHFKDLFFDYSKIRDLEEYQRVEFLQRELLGNISFDQEFHLFVEYYSGTYWSFEQCVWIDALRKVAESFKETPVYYAILSSLMYAMSYTTQSTGHFAQYRDGNTEKAMYDILTYRKKSIYNLFKRKLNSLLLSLDNSLKELITTTLDFEECLKQIPANTTVYADPPYAPVHYSRFYHALETLIKYDYPIIDHKGRYRHDRHQSPFSQPGKALQAFERMFDGIIEKKAQMILSYSGSGVVKIDEIQNLAQGKFGDGKYKIIVKALEYKHSTMGRMEDRNRDVFEYLIIAKFK